jgi:hypothetical protein
MRVDRDDLALGRRYNLLVVERVWPDVSLIDAEVSGHVVAMLPVGHAACDDPALNGLGVYLHGFGELGGSDPPL